MSSSSIIDNHFNILSRRSSKRSWSPSIQPREMPSGVVTAPTEVPEANACFRPGRSHPLFDETVTALPLDERVDWQYYPVAIRERKGCWGFGYRGRSAKHQGLDLADEVAVIMARHEHRGSAGRLRRRYLAGKPVPALAGGSGSCRHHRMPFSRRRRKAGS